MKIQHHEPPPAESPTTSQRPSGLPEWRFGLKSMFAVVTALCVVFALIGSSAGIAPIAISLAVLAIAGHLAGAAFGERLRAAANERARWEGAADTPPPVHHERLAAAIADRHATTANAHLLRQRRPGDPRGFGVFVFGAIGGGLGGFIFLAVLSDHSLFVPRLTSVFGSLSAAVLGAWIAFLAVNFWGIARGCWSDAATVETNDLKRRERQPLGE